jgi:signal transduction histidine kinase
MPRRGRSRSVRTVFRQLRTSQLVVDVVAAGLFGLLVFVPELRTRQESSDVLGTVVVVVLFSGILALRRLSPGLALAGAWLAAIVQMGLGRPPGPVDIAIFGVLYAAAAYGIPLVFWLAFASAFVGALVIALYVYVTGYIGGGLNLQSLSVGVAVLIAALFALLLSWTVGALVRTGMRAASNRREAQRAEADAVAEQQRVRIARDMHDVVAHSLAVVVAQADGARYAAASDPSAALPALETISTTARAALADVRLLLTQLRHTQADGPQPTLADLESLYAQVRAAGVQLSIDVDPAPAADPPAAVQLAVYRILQEALTNAIRHGEGGPVSVRLAWFADRVDLEVRNPAGAGAFAAGAGHGIIGMRERAQLVGGRLDAAPDGGAFVVRAALPAGASA